MHSTLLSLLRTKRCFQFYLCENDGKSTESKCYNYYVKFLLALFYFTSVFLVKGQLVFRLRLSFGIFCV